LIIWNSTMCHQKDFCVHQSVKSLWGEIHQNHLAESCKLYKFETLTYERTILRGDFFLSHQCLAWNQKVSGLLPCTNEQICSPLGAHGFVQRFLSFFFFFGGGIRVWIQGLPPANQVLYYLSHSTSPKISFSSPHLAGPKVIKTKDLKWLSPLPSKLPWSQPVCLSL
jgi:hypothetical protein